MGHAGEGAGQRTTCARSFTCWSHNGHGRGIVLRRHPGGDSSHWWITTVTPAHPLFSLDMMSTFAFCRLTAAHAMRQAPPGAILRHLSTEAPMETIAKQARRAARALGETSYGTRQSIIRNWADALVSPDNISNIMDANDQVRYI